MRFDAGHTDISTAGTRVKLSVDGGINDNDRILWARFKADPGNSGIAYVGIGDVKGTATIHGFDLENNDDVGLELDFRKYNGSILASQVYFDVATNGDNVAWAIIFE